jgi:hypothetical protein
VTDSLSGLLSGVLFVAALVTAIFLFMGLAAAGAGGYLTNAERDLVVGFIGIILALLFIGSRMDGPPESTSTQRVQSDIR